MKMNNMTQEEKAKRYDEALKVLHKYDGANIMFSQSLKEEMFPELKESEDEGVKNYIISCLNNQLFTEGSQADIERKKAIAWLEKHIGLAFHFHQLEEYIMQLEKQCEQKSLDDIAKEVTKDKDAAVSFFKSAGIINENGELADEYKIEQDEQKSQKEVVDNLHNYLYGEQRPAVWTAEDEEELKIALNTLEKAGQYSSAKWLKNVCLVPQPQQEWSEEDESLRRRCIGAIDMANLSDYTKDSLLNWLKSLKDRVQTKPKQEWSKDDEKMFNGIIEAATHHCYLNITDIDWLKCLKERYSWKPSELQIEALESATENCAYSEYQDCLRELIEQLKKLKG